MTIGDRYEYHPESAEVKKGGFASVFKAKDIKLGTEVALKFFDLSTEHKYDLTREVKLAAQLDHPNICKYLDIVEKRSVNVHGQEQVVQIGVMDYINGGTIKEYLEKKPNEFNEIIKQLLSGLDFLHKKNIAHRDIKPNNILVKDDGYKATLKICDFGISKNYENDPSSSKSLQIGSVPYMAPEQLEPVQFGENGAINTKVDIWSFGALVYELLTKKTLIDIDPENNTQGKIINDVLRLETNEKLAEIKDPLHKKILEQALTKKATERADAAAILQTIKEYQRGTAASISKPSAPADAASNKTNILHKDTATPTPPLPKGTNAPAPLSASFASTPNVPTKSNKAKKIVLIAASVAIAMCATIFGIVKFKGKNNEPATPAPGGTTIASTGKQVTAFKINNTGENKDYDYYLYTGFLNSNNLPDTDSAAADQKAEAVYYKNGTEEFKFIGFYANGLRQGEGNLTYSSTKVYREKGNGMPPNAIQTSRRGKFDKDNFSEGVITTLDNTEYAGKLINGKWVASNPKK
jgi:serine/threonine protein kinase